METKEAIKKRVSVRVYDGRPIPKEVLESMVDAGRLAPTARGVEPWEFIVITDKSLLAKIGALANNGNFIADGTACIAILCKNTKYYLEDGCAATENILIAAADVGVGACWVAGDKKDYCERVKSLLGAPAELKLVSMIAMGYPKDTNPPKARRPLASVLHWEKFSGK